MRPRLCSVELSNLEAALFITDPIAKIIKDIHHQGNKMTNQLNWVKRTVTQGILGSLGGTFQPTNFHFPNLEAFPKSNVGKLYRLFQLQPFPWIINDVPMIPQNQSKQKSPSMTHQSQSSFPWINYTYANKWNPYSSATSTKWPSSQPKNLVWSLS